MDSINGKEIKALKQELGARLNKHIKRKDETR